MLPYTFNPLPFFLVVSMSVDHLQCLSKLQQSRSLATAHPQNILSILYVKYSSKFSMKDFILYSIASSEMDRVEHSIGNVSTGIFTSVIPSLKGNYREEFM